MPFDNKVVQITPELVEDFKRKQFIKSAESLDIDLIDLQPGDVPIGILSTIEAKFFVEIEAMKDELASFQYDKSLDMSIESLQKMKEEGYKNFNPATMLESVGERIMPDDEAEYIFELDLRTAYLDNLFWHSLRSRIGCFSGFISIRSGFKVVRRGWKHKRG